MLKRLVMKYFPVAILAVLIVAILGVSRYAEGHKAENQKDAQTSSPKAVVTPNNASKGTQEAGKSEHSPDWFDTFTWPDGVTAWALLLTLLVIDWESTETRMAAQGALLSAQALINAERPWIVMTIEPGKETNEFLLKAVNRGRTPAAILSAGEGLAIIEPETVLPMIPEYSRIKKHEAPVMVVQGEYQIVLRFNRNHLRGMCKDRDQFVQIAGCSQFTYVFGNVVYRDSLAPPYAVPHETRWCCMVWLTDDPDEFFFTDGSAEYTKHT